MMKNRLLTLAGVLALLAVVGKFYAEPVWAQARAALVKNIDERGRNPFRRQAPVQWSDCLAIAT
jgi:hypothetical protein